MLPIQHADSRLLQFIQFCECAPLVVGVASCSTPRFSSRSTTDGEGLTISIADSFAVEVDLFNQFVVAEETLAQAPILFLEFQLASLYRLGGGDCG